VEFLRKDKREGNEITQFQTAGQEKDSPLTPLGGKEKKGRDLSALGTTVLEGDLETLILALATGGEKKGACMVGS